MNKKENRMAVRQAAQQAVIRDEQNHRIEHAATNPIKEVLKSLHTTLRGLDAENIVVSRTKYGTNKVTHEKKQSLAKRLAGAFINPFTAILFCLAVVSTMTDMVFPYFSLLGSSPEDFDPLTVVIILTMVMISGTLRFVQESRSGNAAEKLLSMITTTCTVTRREQEKIEIPMDDLVVGDIVHLSAGDMIPADVRILDAKDLFISQASLTGESEPVEKTPKVCAQKESITDYSNIAFMGSNVISGSATAVVVCTGDRTLFGSMASAIAGEAVETSFTKGVNAVSWVLIRFMLVMVPLVFFINGITKGDWLDAFLFGISVAVGLTPEMLPMIVTTCLAKGAVSMSKKQTIVKNLNSIQNFGAIDILCTDKTGTLTQDKVVLEYHLNVNGEDDTRVLRHAYLNSYFQTGYKNLMDLAIIHRTEEEEAADPKLLDLSENYVKVDEIPFDFTRRRLTTVVQDKKGKTQMVTKGAVEEMLSICSFAECDGTVQPLTEEVRGRILKTVDELNDKGFRVLAIAQKSNPSPVGAFGIKDECEMVLIGYLAFLDPPKESTADAIRALKAHGVTTKILTGDNDKVTRTICKQVGLEVRNMLLGSDLDHMTDEQLAKAVETTEVFAKLTPDQKARVVSVLRENGHTVGFMGDGINDAAAMKAADIGISVDTAVDVAKESADIILLEKDLPGCPAEAFYETDGMLSVEAEHFICNEKADAGAFYVLPEYGKTLSGVKAYPQTKTFFEMAEQIRQAPKLTYQIYVREAGEYEMICYTAPANPVCQGGSVYFGCAVNGNAPQKIEMIPDGYRSGEPSCAEWAKMVVDQIRVVRVQVTLQSGENEIGIYAGTPGFLLEKLTFVRKGKHLPESGLGLPERRRTNR